MIDALIQGRLIRDPSIRTSANGNGYCNFLLSVSTGGEDSTIVSGIAFGEVAERIAKLSKGDALAVAGSLRPSTWTDKASGEIRHGLNVTAQAYLSPYDVRRKRPQGNGSDPQEPWQKQPENSQFDDEIPF